MPPPTLALEPAPYGRPAGEPAAPSRLGRTRSAMRDRLRVALGPGAPGPPGTRGGLTVGRFLETWLTDVVRLGVRPRTYASYRYIVRLHLAPGLGALPLSTLSPADVQAFLNAKAASGLSPRTVGYLRGVLRGALGHAERTDLVNRNVARLARPPRIPRRQVSPLTVEQARTFLGAIVTDRLRALYLVALGVGLRQGEILGLRWRDLDLAAGTLTVRHALARIDGRLVLVEPKSATSRRVVPLPALVRDALVAHRARQMEEPGPLRPESADEFADLVFTTTLGTPLDGITVTRRFQRILAAADLPKQRFHDLRHACASLLLAQGVPARVVMETLGHSEISLTLNTYSHVLPSLGREAADRMDAVLSGVRG
ncbi:MAG: site-specific integrase [Chloroflexi bacterium]|nr:site-specific integrase [Chloroflexota bacterium]